MQFLISVAPPYVIPLNVEEFRPKPLPGPRYFSWERALEPYSVFGTLDLFINTQVEEIRWCSYKD